MKSELIWEEPVPRNRGGAGISLLKRLLPLLHQVQERPEAWARIATWENSTGAHSARKRLSARTDLPGTFSFEARVVDSGSALYARYDGPTG